MSADKETKKSWTYKEITKAAENKIDRLVKRAIERDEAKYYVFNEAIAVHTFWAKLTEFVYTNEDYQRLLGKVKKIL